MPGSAGARGAVNAARFRTAFVQLRASGVLRTACVTAPLFRLGLETGIEAPLGRAHNRKDKTMTTETNTSCPTHRIFAVTKNGTKKFWQPIGALCRSAPL
jgi:hypothetical protein